MNFLRRNSDRRFIEGWEIIMKRTTSLTILSALIMGSFMGTALAAPGNIPDTLANKVDFASQQLKDDATLRSYYEASKYKDELPQSTDIKYDKELVAPQESVLNFEVKELRVTKSELLTADELRSAIQFVGAKTMSVKELQKIVDRINSAYLAKGIQTAQAVLPPQVVRDGVVYIRLIEGRYGEIKVQGNKRILESYVKDRVSATTNELSDLNQLQKDLLLYNNTNNFRLRAELVPGKELGSSDLVLTIDEAVNPWKSYFFVDNANQDESGLYRAGFVSAAYGLSGADDRLLVNPVFTEGTISGLISYDAPISNEGTRANISFSRNRVKIIDGRFEDFDIMAHSNDLSIGVSHPLNVTPLTKIDVFVEAHRKWSNTEYSGWNIADTDTNALKIGLNLRKYDKNGLWFAQVSATSFNTDFNIRNEQADGDYYGAYCMRRQNLSAGQYLLVRAFGQFTNDKELPSSEQFSIGGIATVRGYEESELSGDKGWVASVEYGFPISKDNQSLRGFAFYDHGAVYDNYSATTTRKYISSTGVGLEFFQKGWYGRLALGVPLEDSGNDIHSSKTRTHFYLQKDI